MVFDTIEQAIVALKHGKIIIVVDDENRENEGDFLMVAEKVTTESINFMTKYGRGIVCVPTTAERLKKLDIHPMVVKNSDPKKTAFTVSVDCISNATGVSAKDRADTIKCLVSDNATSKSFTKPGHIFPLISKQGGVLVREGHTEAAVDLAKLAGFKPVGVVCEIMNEDGSMARVKDLEKIKRKHNLLLITIADLIKYRKQHESFVERVTSAKMPTKFGEFTIHGYINTLNSEHHVALVKGDIKGKEPVLVRVHSECLTGDALGSIRCDCGSQYYEAMKRIAKEGRGVLVYMRQEGRGIGLINKLKAYNLQDQGLDTVDANLKLGFPAELREYSIGAQILKDLGLSKIKLMTNNPKKVSGLCDYGLKITKRVPLEAGFNKNNLSYLTTKKQRMGHILHL